MLGQKGGGGEGELIACAKNKATSITITTYGWMDGWMDGAHKYHMGFCLLLADVCKWSIHLINISTCF